MHLRAHAMAIYAPATQVNPLNQQNLDLAHLAIFDFGPSWRGQRSDLDHFNPVFTGFCNSVLALLGE